ncbi:hypothetical protein NDU88_003116 [Pleurodeles waltl]|uniref:Uncharacterized protein n=1 Tax=Pleurodeles waltl TaxID=8319 RepID=A0AAV7T4L2_PLEWA|nr:hypothetical protein NDU88_003116 [Pleurodeles waltl]
MQGYNRGNAQTFANSNKEIYSNPDEWAPISRGLSRDNEGEEKNAEAERKVEKAYDGEDHDGEKEIGIAAMERDGTVPIGEDSTSDPN